MRGRQSLLFTVCCRYLWSRESFVSLVGGCWPPIVYLPISRLHASLSFFFADSPRYLYPPPSASVSVLFVSLSPVTLVAPSPPPSSILEWSTDDDEDPYSATKLHLQKRENIFRSGKQASIPALSPLSPDPLPDLRGLIMLGSFEAR